MHRNGNGTTAADATDANAADAAGADDTANVEAAAVTYHSGAASRIRRCIAGGATS